MKDYFKTSFSSNIFYNKYALTQSETWHQRCITVVDDVTGTMGGTLHPIMSKDDRSELVQVTTDMKFLPGGRYIYYGGRGAKFYNNCYLLRAEYDTREEWASLAQRVTSCLMTGGGIGVDYSILRPSGRILKRTGGTSSGPLPLMYIVNEIGRNVMQGGSRRSAIYASLNWQHDDIQEFLKAKDWHNMPIKDGFSIWDAKQANFNFNAPLDMTNISLNYDDAWLHNGGWDHPTFLANCKQAMMTGEPGFSFNFGVNSKATLRNAPVHPDTWVYTSTGYKQVKDIVNVPVHMWTGIQFAPATFTKTRIDDDTVKVSMTGRRDIICSADHEFILEDGTKVQAQHLDCGMSLRVSQPYNFGGKQVTEAYALAFVYGDGSFATRYPRAEAALCGSKEAVLQRLIDSGIPCEVNRDKRGVLRVYYKNHDIFRSRNKSEFPEEVYSWNKESQREFLAGLADADGYYADGRLRISSKYKSFLLGVQKLCDSIGLLGMINKGSKGNYEGSSDESWSIAIRGELSYIKTSRFTMVDSQLSKVKVVSVEPAGKSDVFCCDVGVDEHSFMANGVIISNCTEVVSEDDSDVCNLGSVNMGNIDTIEEFRKVVNLASKFLVCGTIRAELPYEKVKQVREKNRRLGLGLMGIHEWLLKRGQRYEVTEELHKWLGVYREESERAANEHCDRLFINRPVAYRAIAPTGSIGILAGTTTGIEPLFAVAYKRRYLTEGTKWKYEYVVDSCAETIIKEYGISPDKIETALDLAKEPERRIKFQAEVQEYVDMSISSTINLPAWGTELNNESKVEEFAQTLAKYAPRLRGFTCYPDGARGGQPLTTVDYEEAKRHKGTVFEEHDICSITGHGGSCGV